MHANKLAFFFLLMASPVCADKTVEQTESEDSLPIVLWERFKTNTTETWHSPQHHELYLPVFVWHPPFAWDKDRREDYNENPWGAGYGLSRYDTDGDWHALYLMVFKDSLNEWEPVGGYAYEKIWRPLEDKEDFRLGLGFTAGITMRDNWDYFPVPILLPMGSVGYKNLTFQATYVPGLRNKGNVLFGWFRWKFD